MKNKSDEHEFYAIYPCPVCEEIHIVTVICSGELIEYLFEQDIDYKDEIKEMLVNDLVENFKNEHPFKQHMFDKEAIIFIIEKERR